MHSFSMCANTAPWTAVSLSSQCKCTYSSKGQDIAPPCKSKTTFHILQDLDNSD